MKQKVGVVYFSGSGTTRVVAKAVCEGIGDTGEVEVFELDINGADISEGRWANDALAAELDGCAGIVFGSPTYMGDVSAQLKSFFDAMAPRWFSQAWNGKVAAGFTASSLAAGDKLNCLQSMCTFAMQMGMVWVGTGASFQDQLNPNGFYLGAGVTASTPDQVSDMDRNTARHLGGRVAEIVSALAPEG